MSLIEAAQLSVSGLAAAYAGSMAALCDVSVELRTGEVIAIVGANGAGKTTLMRAIANLLSAQRGHVTAGSIRLNGRDIARRKPADLVRAGLASVVEGRRCFKSMTLEENLIAGAAARGLSRGSKRRAIDQVYDLFPSLLSKRRVCAGLLSGGEQQMTAIGRALMTEPTLLLLDEPSMGLAPLAVQSIFDALSALNRKSNLSILFAEQNARLAQRYAHRVYALTSGSSAVVDRSATDLIETSYFG